jgi:hypothetical protein
MNSPRNGAGEGREVQLEPFCVCNHPFSNEGGRDGVFGTTKLRQRQQARVHKGPRQPRPRRLTVDSCDETARTFFDGRPTPMWCLSGNFCQQHNVLPRRCQSPKEFRVKKSSFALFSFPAQRTASDRTRPPHIRLQDTNCLDNESWSASRIPRQSFNRIATSALFAPPCHISGVSGPYLVNNKLIRARGMVLNFILF